MKWKEKGNCRKLIRMSYSSFWQIIHIKNKKNKSTTKFRKSALIKKHKFHLKEGEYMRSSKKKKKVKKFDSNKT
jgi:hypothetical protein